MEDGGPTGTIAIAKVNHLMRPFMLTQTLCSELEGPKTRNPSVSNRNKKRKGGGTEVQGVRTRNSSLNPHLSLGQSESLGPIWQAGSRLRVLQVQPSTL